MSGSCCWRFFGGLAFTGYEYWLANRNIEDTDDAFVDGNAVTISPQVSGNVVSLDITDNQFVKKNQPLIHIDNRQYVIDVENAKANLATAEGQYAGFQYAAEVAKKNFPAQLDAAKAQLQSAQAQVIRAQADYDRQKSLPTRATTQQEVDAATAALRQAEAQVAQAQAQVEQDSPVHQRIGQAEASVSQFHGQIEQAKARLDQGAAQSLVDHRAGAAGRLDYQAQRQCRHLCHARPADFLFSLAAGVDHGEL